jgi:hypothetical protein
VFHFLLLEQGVLIVLKRVFLEKYGCLVGRERDGEFSPWLPLGGLGVGAVWFYEVVKDSASKYLRNVVSHTPLPPNLSL